MRRAAGSLSLAAVLLLSGALPCGCSEQGLPLVARVIGVVGPGKLGLVERELRTVDDLAELRGRVAHFRRGGRLVFDEQALDELERQAWADDEELTVDQLRDEVVRDSGEPVALNWQEHDGVIVPEDWDSLALLSAYAQLEQAWFAFAVPGSSPPERLPTMDAYYEPVFHYLPAAAEQRSLLRLPLLDNAMYFAPSRSFLFLAQQELEGVPLTVNPGVIVHEYAHAWFDQLAFGGDQLTRTAGLSERPANLLASFDEGTADYLAADLTGDANFLALSLPAEAAAGRDLTAERRASEALLAAAGGQPHQSGTPVPQYDPYPLGTVWAAALWSLRRTVGATSVNEALFRALGDLADARLTGFEATTLPEAFVRRTDERAAACTVLRRVFAAASWPADSACERTTVQQEEP